MSTKTFTPTAIEQAYALLVRRHGQPGPAARRIDLQDPIADDGETDCWSHAWQVARAVGARYVEGLCMTGSGNLSQHAWVEEDTPFGPRIVETTPGYERAYAYRGITIDCADDGVAAEVTAHWDGPRSSVIQAALGGGGTPEQVLAALAPAARR